MTVSRKGFTLIELSVVVALLGIMLVIAFPRFSGLIQGRRLMGFCGQLSGALDYVRARAVIDSQIYHFHFDRRERKYWVTREGEREEEEPIEGRLGRPRSFPPDITIKRVKVENRIGTRRWPVIRFYPRGNADEAVIYLETDGKDRASIWVKPYTGRSEVFNYFYRG